MQQSKGSLKMEKMPVLFIGHGSPMNAVEDNVITKQWKTLGRFIPQPKAILSISAHWYEGKSYVQSAKQPRQVYDMYGFPSRLYELEYPVLGNDTLTRRVQELLGTIVSVNNEWGIDHGTWSVLVHIYPKGDIPIVQLSINGTLKPKEQFAIGQALQPLREEGILILGSGNVVHNLGLLAWDEEGGFAWADEFDEWVKQGVSSKEEEKLFNYTQHKYAIKAVPTTEHLAPLFYCLGAVHATQYALHIINNMCVMGSLSMTSYIFKSKE